jgi:hypothetical protein
MSSQFRFIRDHDYKIAHIYDRYATVKGIPTLEAAEDKAPNCI